MRVIILVFLFCYAGLAYAEGGTCPPGFYPINSPGAMGCAPIPDGESGASSSAIPRVVWEDRWGAIASNNKTSNVGTIGNQPNQRSAKKIALERCGEGCKLDIVYYNQCAAIAWGNRSYSVNGAANIEVASERAMSVCGQSASDCKIVFTECSLPVRVQ